MSNLLRKVTFTLESHPNADSLSIAYLNHLGWQCIIRTAEWGEIREGLYVPLDALVDVSKPTFSFLKSKEQFFRIKTIRLRQKISQGLLIKIEPWMENLSTEEIEKELNIQKYEPPIPMHLRGDMIRCPGEFKAYKSIENINNFPDMFVEDEEVIVTEKIHGTNFRVGFVNDGTKEFKYYVGSHGSAKKIEGENLYSVMARKLIPEESLIKLASHYPFDKHFIVFGELYGHKVQRVWYDCGLNEQKIAIFDVLMDDRWIPWNEVETVAKKLGLLTAPLLYQGPFHKDLIKTYRDGKSTLAEHLREGIVIKPIAERESEIGRVFCKCLSPDFKLRVEDVENKNEEFSPH